MRAQVGPRPPKHRVLLYLQSELLSHRLKPVVVVAALATGVPDPALLLAQIQRQQHTLSHQARQIVTLQTQIGQIERQLKHR